MKWQVPMVTRTLAVVTAAVLTGATAGAAQVELTTGDAYLNTGNLSSVGAELKDPGAPAGSGILPTAGGEGRRSNPWVYAFTPGGGGLQLNTFKIYTDVDAYNESTNTKGGGSFTLDLGGGDIYGTSGSLSLSTLMDTTGWGGYGSGDIRVYNVGTVDIGAIDTHNRAYYEWAGAVYIGEPAGTGNGPATGNIRVDAITGWDSEQVSGGYVNIYGLHDVQIQTSGGTPTPSDIDVHGPNGKSSSPVMQIEVINAGHFVARDLLTYCSIQNASGNAFGNYIDMGGVSLDGGGAGGDCTVRNINTSIDIRDINGVIQSSFKYWDTAGSVAITGYANVKVNDIDAHHATGSTDATADAGNVNITSIDQNITIEGAIDLSVAGFANQDKGILNLQCDGAIVMAALDLSKLRYAALDAGGDTTINGLITGTDGLPAGGLGNIGTALRTPSGQFIYYSPAMNQGLGGLDYTLSDLAGTAGAGGTLTPVPEPATLSLLGLGSLGVAMLRRRRRRRS